MTASSIELFPCRVQLMGLPRSPSAATVNTSSSLGDTVRPPYAKLQKISRNLFGAPDPIEMKNMYQEEAERLRSYVLQRYNFDTKIFKPTSEQQPTDKSHTNQTTIQPTQFPTLIEQELRKHEKRLQDEGISLNRAFLETSPSNKKVLNCAKNICKVTRRCEYSTSLLHAIERQKPYTRQSLLTESFNIRKNKGCVTKNEEPCENAHQNDEIFQFSEQINSHQKICNFKQKGNKLPSCKEGKNNELSGMDTSIRTTVSYEENCKQISLQVVVSTKNAS